MPSAERRVAIDAARAAGLLLREALTGPRQVAFKDTPTNLVTDMDARVERVVSEQLRDAFPDDAILGEEGGTRPGTSGRRWIVDPLDGTTNFAHGLPVFAVSIGLEVAGRVVLGVVYDPNRDELFVAEHGAGAWLDEHRIGVSSTPTLDASLIATGFPYNVRETADNNVREFAAFTVRAQGVRRMGSAVVYLSYVAAGRIDGYWELRLAAWDVAAGALLVEEAGGRVTALDGGPLDLDAPAIVASNGRIHGEMLDVLKETRKA